MAPIAVFAIFGPTAAGKTAIAEAVAHRLGTAVVSADAMQVYRGLPILTNQPEQPTLLVAIRSLDETMSVGEYAELAHVQIDRLVAERGTAVVAGGTGLYLRAALVDMRVPAQPAPGVRAALERAYDADAQAVYGELMALDSVAAAAIHRNDRRRVVRALELARAGESLARSESRLWSGEMRHPTVTVGLDVPVATLEQRIAARTEVMFQRGVVREVRTALACDISKTAAKTLGLDEIASLPEDEARARILVRTRQYATYQRKWMRRIPGIVMVDGTRPTREVVDEILEVARAR